MRRNRRLSSVLASALIGLVIAGCSATPERVYVQPQCSAPPQPSLPDITGDELAALGEDTYWRLEERERRLADWAFEMQAILQAVCEE